eukprot:3062865-Amphidinium_carterae.1
MKMILETKRSKEERENINEMFQDLYYDPMQNLLDDVEMTDLMEYQLTQQYLKYKIYPETMIHSQMTRENTSRSSRKPSTTT